MSHESALAILSTHGFDSTEALVAEFKDWSDCHDFACQCGSVHLPADQRALADAIWSIVLDAQGCGSSHILAPCSPTSPTGHPAPKNGNSRLDRLDEEAGRRNGFADDEPTSRTDRPGEPTGDDIAGLVLERAADSKPAKPSTRRMPSALSSMPPTQSTGELPTLHSEMEVTRAQGKKTGTAIVQFKHIFESWDKNWLSDKAQEWKGLSKDPRLPRWAKWLLNVLYSFRRPSLMRDVPTAFIHFALVESSSLVLISMAWFNILCMRLGEVWLSNKQVAALVSCSKTYAETALRTPLVRDLEYECSGLGFPDISRPSLWNVQDMAICSDEAFDPLNVRDQRVIGFCFYLPMVVLLVLVVYRSLLFLAHCGCARPMSFASGAYVLFCWELPRNRLHKFWLSLTLCVFVSTFIFVIAYSYWAQIGFEGGSRVATAFFILVLVDKLADLGKGEVPQHKFQLQPFFGKTVFRRSWMNLCFESSYHLSTRLMDALWRWRAGDKRALREMLERPKNLPADARSSSADMFFEQCEAAQLSETQELDKQENYALHEEEIEHAAKMMFGDDLVARPDGALAVMKTAMQIKHEAEQEVARMNGLLKSMQTYVDKAKAEAENARQEKKEAIERAVQSEQELAKLRALGERLMMREKECIRLQEEVEHSLAKDSQLAKLMDENNVLKEASLTPTVPQKPEPVGWAPVQPTPQAVVARLPPSSLPSSHSQAPPPGAGVGDISVRSEAVREDDQRQTIGSKGQGLLGSSLTPAAEGHALSHFRRGLSVGNPSHLGDLGLNTQMPSHIP